MPRTKYDVIRDIGRIKAAGSGVFSYKGNRCIKCEKSVSGEIKVDIYDICFNCYDANADPAKDRLMSLINELERLQLQAQQG